MIEGYSHGCPFLHTLIHTSYCQREAFTNELWLNHLHHTWFTGGAVVEGNSRGILLQTNLFLFVWTAVTSRQVLFPHVSIFSTLYPTIRCSYGSISLSLFDTMYHKFGYNDEQWLRLWLQSNDTICVNGPFLIIVYFLGISNQSNSDAMEW